MSEQELLASYKKISPSRILVIVIDGLGGLRHPDFRDERGEPQSELEYAKLPNLDALVNRPETVLGTLYPVKRGWIPGSAAGHFALFGYDPLLPEHRVGRGILEALDLGIAVEPGDVVARLNFATFKNGVVTDRRARRFSEGHLLAQEINNRISVKGAKVKVVSTREHRGVLFLHHEGQPLGCGVTDTDPGEVNKAPLPCKPLDDSDPAAARTAKIVNSVFVQTLEILEGRQPANGILLRGFSGRPNLPTLAELHGLEAVAIADYPLYRGIARLLGMRLGEPVPSLEEKISQLKVFAASSSTFFFFHYKEPDSRGEDGDFLGKVKALEAFDKVVPAILDIFDSKSDVVAITGDHSTPSIIAAHSHHSVPLLLFSNQNKGYDDSRRFTERECTHGTFGRERAVVLMACLLARAGKLRKFDL